jgi:HlyD family secretion protein
MTKSAFESPHGDEPLRLRDTARQDRPVEADGGWRQHRRKLIAVLVVIIALSALLALLAHFKGIGSSIARSSLTIASVERGRFVRDVAADGQVVAAVSPTLYAASAGSVTLQVHAGDAVHQNQVVATLSSPDLAAKLSQEQSSMEGARLEWQRTQLDASSRLSQSHQALAQSEVDLKTTQREFERSRKAFELGAYSELQMMRAQDAFEKAKFAEQQARANDDAMPAQNRFDIDSRRSLLERQRLVVDDLRRQVDALQIRSPVDGSVGQVQIADRATVARDTPLLTVVDLTALEVEIKVPESLARDLAPGMTADLQGNGQHYQGRVSGISPQVVAGEVIARVRFDDATARDLRQNQRLSVRILIDQRDDTLMVERGDFVDRQGGAYAYVVHGNFAQRQGVQLGAVSVQQVEILDGLSVGDQVVVSGAEAFNGAQRIVLTR